MSKYHAGYKRLELGKLLADRMNWLSEPEDIERLVGSGLNTQQLADLLAKLDAAEGTEE